MHRNFGLSLIVATLVILAMFGRARADVSNATVSEQATASARILPQPAITDTHNNSTLPPIDVSAEADAGSNSAASGVNISSYIGPTSAADVTGGLTLQGNTTASSFTVLSGLASGSATITFTFTLDATQHYNYSADQPTQETFSGPAGPDIQTGFGDLPPGDYTFTSTASA